MSLLIRRKPGRGPENTILLKTANMGPSAEMEIRVIKVDPDKTVHLAFSGDSKISVLRAELADQPPRDFTED